MPRLYSLLGLLATLVLVRRMDIVNQFWLSDSDNGTSNTTGVDKGKQLRTRSSSLKGLTVKQLHQQPELDALKWFLSEEELTKSRHGVEREHLHVYSKGNKVETLPAGDVAFANIFRDIEGTKCANSNHGRTQDFVYIAGWGIHDIELIPGRNETRLLQVLERAVKRGVQIRIMIWDAISFSSKIHTFDKYVNNVLDPIAKKYGCRAQMIRDNRMGFGSTQHQKTISIKNDASVVSYVGGLDMMLDRWDTVNHDQAEFRKAQGIHESFSGWIDAHVRVQGSAALDILWNFVERWNDPQPLGSSQKLLSNITVLPLPQSSIRTNDKMEKQATLISNMVSKNLISLEANNAPLTKLWGEHEMGQLAIQTVRTYPCIHEWDAPFAPTGEVSLFASHVKAIRTAKNYIFIQDQYFIYVEELLQELLDALPNIQALVIMVEEVQLTSKVTGYEKYQYEMIHPLIEQFPNKVKVFTVQNDIFIHSKMLIIDDVYVSIGTGNWNRRSMTSDSEIAASIVGTQTKDGPDHFKIHEFAYWTRIEKFAEAASISTDKLDGLPFFDALAHLDQAALDPHRPLAFHSVNYKHYFALFGSLPRDLIDQDDRCAAPHAATSVRNCLNATWVSEQTDTIFDICACIRQEKDIETCHELQIHGNDSTTQYIEHYVDGNVVHVLFISIALLLLVLLCSIVLTRHQNRRQYILVN